MKAFFHQSDAIFCKIYPHLFINPRRACAARVTVVCFCLSVCLCVCVSTFNDVVGGLLAIPAASELREPEKQKANFPETTALEGYAVKTSEKGNMHNRTGLAAT